MADRVAVFLPCLAGGGAERVMLTLAHGLQARGVPVDLVLARAEGPLLESVPDAIRLIDLRARRVLTSLPGLARYLRRERPSAIISAMTHANVVAIWARALAGVPTRVVVSQRTTLSKASSSAIGRRDRLLPQIVRRVYPRADAIVAVSAGVADDLARIASLARDRITVIYNPVITEDLERMASEPLEHPWFREGEPPVVLSVGRLTPAKDFPTLLRAFALVRRRAPARLVILGEGTERARLEWLAQELGITDDVAMPGFDPNPFRYMARAKVYALSSAWEGLPGALIQAMACGCPVVSTDCPSGPHEVLEGGTLGALVPVGDSAALAAVIYDRLSRSDRGYPEHALARFRVERAVADYLNVARGTAPC
jgi:glycosyltransferase involved in cell wall biosynthesis